MLTDCNYFIPEKLSEKRLLQERNQQLRSDLKKLEMRAETLKENIESKNLVKKKLLSEQIETQKNLQKLLEFVGKFKDTPSYPVRRLVKEDSNYSDSNWTIRNNPNYVVSTFDTWKLSLGIICNWNYLVWIDSSNVILIAS